MSFELCFKNVPITALYHLNYLCVLLKDSRKFKFDCAPTGGKDNNASSSDRVVEEIKQTLQNSRHSCSDWTTVQQLEQKT